MFDKVWIAAVWKIVKRILRLIVCGVDCDPDDPEAGVR